MKKKIEKVITSKHHQKLMKKIAEENARYKEEHKGQLTYKNKMVLFMISIGLFAFGSSFLRLYKSIIIPLWFVIPVLVVLFSFMFYFMVQVANGMEYPLRKETTGEKDTMKKTVEQKQDENLNTKLTKHFIYSSIILIVLMTLFFVISHMLTDTKNTLRGKQLSVEFCNLFYNNTPTSVVDNHHKLMLLMTPEFLKRYKEIFDDRTYSDITVNGLKSNYEVKRIYKKMVKDTMIIKVLGVVSYTSTKNNKMTDPADITTSLYFTKDKYDDWKIDNMETTGGINEVPSIDSKLIKNNRKITKEEGFEEL